MALRRQGANLGAVYALGAALHPGCTAAVDDAGAATFAEMDRRAAAVAAGLAARGVGEGDAVAVLCRNHRGFLLAIVALGMLGADTVYLNTGFAAPQLADVVEREGVGALVVDEEFVPLCRRLGDRPVIVAWWDPTGRPPVGVATLQDLLGADPADRPARPTRIGRQVLLTSGTTGTPKGAARPTPSDVRPVVGLIGAIPFRTGDVTVMAAPMFHAWGLATTALALALGATLVLARTFDPEDALARVADARASVLVAVPVMLQRILALPDEVLDRYELPSLRVTAVSGSAVPPSVAERWMDRFGDNLYSLYGSTEVGWVSVAAPADLRSDPQTAGRILPGTSVRIVDEDGSPVGPGDSGRILVRSALTFEGYTGGGGKEVLDGAMASGDVGHIDRSGLLFVDGRDDDMVVSGGENVFPREVEDLIAGLDGIAEAAVAGVPDDDFGHRLEAWVVAVDGRRIDETELLATVRASLARYKVPRRVHVVDALPRTPTGKVRTRELVGRRGRNRRR